MRSLRLLAPVPMVVALYACAQGDSDPSPEGDAALEAGPLPLFDSGGTPEDGNRSIETGPKDAGRKDTSPQYAPEGAPCTAAAPEIAACGICGTKARACLPPADGGADAGGDASGAADAAVSGVWGPWGACVGEVTDSDACDPSVLYTDVDCGNCGKRKRVCQSDCHFNTATPCVEPTFGGALACIPGSIEFVPGLSCSGANEGRSRSCSAQCQWGAAGSCETFALPPNSRRLAAGSQHTCLIVPGGTMKCWGSNSYGQLGNGTVVSSNVPVVSQGISTAVAASGGTTHTCALLSSGDIRCWGQNANGELGIGSTSPSAVPVAPLGVPAASSLSTGAAHTCALVSGGVECWGFGGSGQLGSGNLASSKVAIVVPGLSDAMEVAAAGSETCAIVSGGAVQCWGNNYWGQLGNGASMSNSLIPVYAQGIGGATELAGGTDFMCALFVGGTVKCWGENNYGQLGDGSNNSSPVPVVVSGILGAVALRAGVQQACALFPAGNIKCWGRNVLGALGDGTQNDAHAPVAVNGIANAKEVALGSYHACALLAGGDVKCWGDNSNGQLGNGTTTSSLAPVSVTGVP